MTGQWYQWIPSPENTVGGCFLLTSGLCQVFLLDQSCLSALMPWSCTCGYPLFGISFHRFPSSLRRQKMEKKKAKLSFPLGGKKALCWYVASLCSIKMKEKKNCISVGCLGMKNTYKCLCSYISIFLNTLPWERNWLLMIINQKA